MPHIFEPVVTTKPLGARTGLGLAVESHGVECILIAEDEPAVRHVVERVLTALGYRPVALTD